MRKIYVTLIIFSVIANGLRAQTYACPSSNIYYLGTGAIFKYDPTQIISATNPTSIIPCNGNGLAFCNNVNGAGPSPTFYTIIGGTYNYWNGSTWINTTHSTGNAAAVNPTGGDCYIHNFVGSNGDVYRYDGSGNGTLLSNVTGFAGGGPFDLASDFYGNFYALKTSTPQSMQMFDYNGFPIITYNLIGIPNSFAGAGFAVEGNNVYAMLNGGFYTGLISGTTVNFTLTAPNTAFPGASDMANCPNIVGLFNQQFSNTGPIGCGTNTVNVYANGWTSGTTYSWTGPGISSGASSATAIVNSPGVYNCSIVAPGSCPTILTTTVAFCTGLGNIGLNVTRVMTFPNPALNNFTVRGNSSMQLNLVNELGQIVREIELKYELNNEAKIENVPGGIYFLTDAVTNKQIGTKIIVIEN